jgi:hypothetical protein
MGTLQKYDAPTPSPREPIIAPGGLLRLAFLLAVLLTGNLIFKAVLSIIEPTPRHAIAPPEIQELTARCIMLDDMRSCAIIAAWRRPG